MYGELWNTDLLGCCYTQLLHPRKGIRSQPEMRYYTKYLVGNAGVSEITSHKCCASFHEPHRGLKYEKQQVTMS